MVGSAMTGEERMEQQLSQGRYDIAELFSPPRMTSRADLFNLVAGWSLDTMYMDPITKKSWDLSDPIVQEKVI